MSISLTEQPDVIFNPTSFEDRPFLLRALAGRTAIDRYAVLRASGYGLVPSFARCFGSVIIGPLDELRTAAQSFERTNLFKFAFEEAVARLGSDLLRSEHAARIAEAAEHAPPVSIAAENLSDAERDSRERIDRDDTQKLATFVSSVRESLREKATAEAIAAESGRSAFERFQRNHRNSFFSQ